jgi:hypothetical protein
VVRCVRVHRILQNLPNLGKVGKVAVGQEGHVANDLVAEIGLGRVERPRPVPQVSASEERQKKKKERKKEKKGKKGEKWREGLNGGISNTFTVPGHTEKSSKKKPT